jgi:hypothetical protein
MAAPKTMNGARAKLGIYDPSTGQTRYIGIFQNVSYGLTFQAEPVYILGKFAAAEIDYTSQDVVQITASGWRVIEHGPHVEAGVPRLQDLLSHEYLELAISDRQREAQGKDGRIAKFRNVRPVGYSTQISARQLEEVTVNFVAILVDDESTTNNEHPSAMQLP